MISQNKAKGFTIVELLIVIVIIGILAAISIVAYNGVMSKSRDSERQSDARNIANAVSLYKAEKDEWPTAAQLKTFDTAKLSGKASSELGTVPTASAKGTYGLTACPSTGAQTGARISYYKESSGTGTDAPGVKTIDVGAGCS